MSLFSASGVNALIGASFRRNRALTRNAKSGSIPVARLFTSENELLNGSKKGQNRQSEHLAPLETKLKLR
jgi:hypothetical protein